MAAAAAARVRLEAEVVAAVTAVTAAMTAVTAAMTASAVAVTIHD